MIEKIKNIAVNSIKSEYIKKYLNNKYEKNELTLDECVAVILHSELSLYDKQLILSNMLSILLNEQIGLTERFIVNFTSTLELLDNIVAGQRIIDGKSIDKLLYTTMINDKCYCASSIKSLLETIKEIDGIEPHSVIITVHSSIDVKQLYELTLNDNFEVCNINNLISEKNYFDNIINIADIIDLGDSVKEKNSNSEYIVVAIPDVDFCKFEDMFIEVIPKNIVGTEVNIKEEIDKAYQERIKHFCNNELDESCILDMNTKCIYINDLVKG